MTHTSIASPRLCLLLLSSRHAKSWHNWLPKGLRCLPNRLGTEGRHCRRLPKRLLGLHAANAWQRLAILLLPGCKGTCRCRRSCVALQRQAHNRYITVLAVQFHPKMVNITCLLRSSELLRRAKCSFLCCIPLP